MYLVWVPKGMNICNQYIYIHEHRQHEKREAESKQRISDWKTQSIVDRGQSAKASVHSDLLEGGHSSAIDGSQKHAIRNLDKDAIRRCLAANSSYHIQSRYDKQYISKIHVEATTA